VIHAQVRPAGLAVPLFASAVLHVGLAVWILALSRSGGSVSLPPMYKVELIAAPPGAPAIGVVTSAPPDVTAPTPPTAAPKPVENAIPIKKPLAKPVSKKPPVKATPNSARKPAVAANAPRAAGGAVGGPGTDVANIRTEGIDFPFPGYLQNIVRQVRLNFSPSDKTLRTAEVFFLIRRDGSMAGFRFLQKSGSYAFDLECQGAVEAASAAKAWGPLPVAFMDDVLPVIFRFDPKTLR
jgi:protein TonB